MTQAKCHQPDHVLYARLRWLLDRYTTGTVLDAISEVERTQDATGRQRRFAVEERKPKQQRLRSAG